MLNFLMKIFTGERGWLAAHIRSAASDAKTAIIHDIEYFRAKRQLKNLTLEQTWDHNEPQKPAA